MGRALTKRQKRPEVSAPMPLQREGSTKFASGTIKRSKISGPVDLVSSTNLIAYTSPDIHHSRSQSQSQSHMTAAAVPKPPSASSSTSSLRSGGGDDSDIPQCSTPVTSPEIPSQDSSPVSAEPKKQDHQLYHHTYSGSQHTRSGTNNSSAHSHSHSRSSASTSTSTSNASATKAAAAVAAPPPVPQRSLSHTKKSHQDLARQRSVSKMAPPTSISSTHASRVSQEQPYHPHHALEQKDHHHHPFGQELEQVNEVAEEFGGYIPEVQEEEQTLLAKGFRKFSAEDYLLEIQDLHRAIFHDELSSAGRAWI